MSHQPERREKNCLNCGAELHGRFCHVCGQENVVTHQKFWSLAKHFVFDILHFDGKFFHTLLHLFSKPGYVAKQYVQGKRVSHLDPIRMYLFTSAVFFLVFFSAKMVNVHNGNDWSRLSNNDRKELIQEYNDRMAKNPADSFLRQRIAVLKDTTVALDLDSLGWEEEVFSYNGRSYASLKDYNDKQAKLSAADKDGWLTKLFVKQVIKVNEEYRNGDKFMESFLEIFLHKLPYLLFLSLPFFAGILKLLYTRRKNFYYSDHAVFTLYHYIFSFILILLIIGVAALYKWLQWGVIKIVMSVLFLAWPVYLFLEMKTFYRQSVGKTFGKFLLLNVAGILILFLLFVIFLLFSIFQL